MASLGFTIENNKRQFQILVYEEEEMKKIRFLFYTCMLMTLFFIGSGFASGIGDNAGFYNSDISLIVAEPVRALFIGMILMGIGLFGSRRFVKRSSY